MKIVIGVLLLIVIVVTVNAVLVQPTARASQKSMLKVMQGGAIA